MCLVVIGSITYFAAGQGGKAEPNRLDPLPGRELALTGFLSNGQEMEYVFAGRKGEKITVKNLSPSLFDFRIFSPEADYETEFDSSRIAAFELPADGEYLLFVRKKMVRSPRRARFRLALFVR